MLPAFRNPALFTRALTHRSYVNEKHPGLEDNQRLEFLGDAVLSFVVAGLLYHRFPEMKEGQLTRLRITVIRTEQLAEFARQVGLREKLLLGKGEETNRNNESLLCDAFEAVLGALYLDAGVEAVRAFLEPLVMPVIEAIIHADADRDAKSRLQEWTQGDKLGTPAYHLIATLGPDQAKIMVMEARLGEQVLGAGMGRNKQIASQTAAHHALTALRDKQPRLLITGGAGFLGARLAQAAASAGWQVFVTFHHTLPAHSAAYPLELQDEAAVQALVRRLRPQALIHTACSNKNADHIASIVPAARHVARAAAHVGARLVHCSTDMVFDGEHAPYADDAPPAPIHPYGAAKAEAEALIQRECPGAAIARTSLIWGLNPPDAPSQWLLDAARTGQPVTLFTDEVRSPVYVHDLCAVLLELAARPELTGAFNTGGEQSLSRWDFGLRLLAAHGVPRPPHVRAGLVAEAPTARARNLTMRSDRVSALLRNRLRGVDEVLRDIAPHALP